MAMFSLSNSDPLISSSIWGQPAGNGEAISICTPLDNSCIGETRQLDENEIELLLAPLEQPVTIAHEDMVAFLPRLHSELEALSPQIFEALQLETGFTRADSIEAMDGIKTFVRDFHKLGFLPSPRPALQLYSTDNTKRSIRQITVPWGTIAVILPANAALFLAVTCLLNGLAMGNRVILRFPTACPLSAALMCRALSLAKPPSNAASVVMAPAKPLLTAVRNSPASILIHYLGSSRHGTDVLMKGFEKGKPVITDGEGNTWVWVSEKADISATADILTQGALRYNGQTCTSVNGALIHPDIYDAVREELVKRWQNLRVGDPRDPATDVGPLGDEKQAEWCLQRIETSGGLVLCGGERRSNALVPTLVENPQLDSEFVTQGLFGPALWIARGEEKDFIHLWTSNHYPLCAGVLSEDASGPLLAARLDNVARVVMNGDPSIEWTFEPWGDYPASGNNVVSSWADKYCRVIALDEQLPS